MTITLTREEAADVLYALADAAGCVQQNYQPGHLGHGWSKEIEILRARLAQPEPKQRTGDCLLTGVCVAEGHHISKAQRNWQGLTDDERTYLAWESKNGPHCVDMTEAMLKEKNR